MIISTYICKETQVSYCTEILRHTRGQITNMNFSMFVWWPSREHHEVDTHTWMFLTFVFQGWLSFGSPQCRKVWWCHPESHHPPDLPTLCLYTSFVSQHPPPFSLLLSHHPARSRNKWGDWIYHPKINVNLNHHSSLTKWILLAFCMTYSTLFSSSSGVPSSLSTFPFFCSVFLMFFSSSM